MSNKTHTPITEFIRKLELRLADTKSLIDPNRDMPITTFRVLEIEYIIKLAKLELPAERKFAEECFDVGEQYRQDKIDESELGNDGDINPIDFSTFYKNNYEDGK